MKSAIIGLLLLPLFAPLALSAQNKIRHTVAGVVRDGSSGETLIGATAVLMERPSSGTLSNGYGFYSITAPAGSYHLLLSFSGYGTDTLLIDLDKDTTLSVSLSPGVELKEVIVSGRTNKNITQSLMGVQKLSTADIKNVPVLFGERDILKTIQLLPGIESAGDGNSGFFVRGGASDQNLILLDEATVYNPSHLLGFFSTFNSDAIKDVTVYKGEMPAQYGGRLSSVLDVRMNDGNDQRYVVSGGLGLIASHLNFEGPIKKHKGSFLVTARRTYADLFLKVSKDTALRQSTLYFYDLNLKADYSFNDRDRIYLSGYFGKDVLSADNQFGINWGNATATLRWNHIFSNRLFSNTSLIYSDYKYNIGITTGNDDITIASKIVDLHFKEDFQYSLGTDSKLNFGLDIVHHTLSPAIINTDSASSFNALSLQQQYSLESAAYVSHEWSPTRHWKITYGARLSDFSVMGPGIFNTYDSTGKVTASATYNSSTVVKRYLNLEPRFSASYQLNDENAVKFAYARNVQNLHLLSNSTSNNPTDLWIPSSPNVNPEIADQVSAGYYRNIDDNRFELSGEVYYKFLQHQIDYKNGAQLEANANVEGDLLYGNGRAYGIELYAKKTAGKLTGWISYTLSRSELKIPGINNGSYYPSREDEPQNISVVATYKASKKWTLSADWVYNTGYPVTWPSGKYEVNGQPVYLYGQRNANRVPDYSRLDLSATVVVHKTARSESSWTFSIYNAYDRWNAYTITFRQDPNNPEQTQALKTALFGVIPSVTYNFKF
jgi:hypothetical protein